jgi:hypothetical protein
MKDGIMVANFVGLHSESFLILNKLIPIDRAESFASLLTVGLVNVRPSTSCRSAALVVNVQRAPINYP